jgi:hypothetical protein
LKVSVRKAEKGFAFLIASSLDEVAGNDGGGRGDRIGEISLGGGTHTEDSCDTVAAVAVERCRLLYVRSCPESWVLRDCPGFRRAKLPLIAVRIVLQRYCTSGMVLRK